MGLANFIWQGFPITSVFKGGHRKKDNFEAAQFIGVDIDDSQLDLEMLYNEEFFRKHGAIVHRTKSSTPEAPRSRLIFCLQSPVRDAEEFRLIQRGVTSLYPDADPACVDPARWFWGNAGLQELGDVDGIRVRPDNWLPNELAVTLGENASRSERPQGPIVMPTGDLDKALRGLIAKSSNGNRNAALNWYAHKLGKENVPWTTVEQQARNFQAAVDDPRDPFPAKEAIRTAQSGWQAGMRA
jgi:hypothetical protein